MAKLINCKACGKEISKGAKKCPNCGHDQRSFFGKHKIITGIIALIVIIGAAGAAGSNGSKGKDNDTKETSASSKKEETKKPETKITYDNYIKISMGEKYEDVVALLGNGTESSSSEIDGIKTKMYEWKGDGLSDITVTVQNNLVSDKAQAGLKEMDAKITLAKYDQIKEGMTYDQVKAVLGEGEEVSHSKIADIETVMYEWINKDGSNANFTFQGDKLQLKSQFELK